MQCEQQEGIRYSPHPQLSSSTIFARRRTCVYVYMCTGTLKVYRRQSVQVRSGRWKKQTPHPPHRDMLGIYFNQSTFTNELRSDNHLVVCLQASVHVNLIGFLSSVSSFLDNYQHWRYHCLASISPCA